MKIVSLSTIYSASTMICLFLISCEICRATHSSDAPLCKRIKRFLENFLDHIRSSDRYGACQPYGFRVSNRPDSVHGLLYEFLLERQGIRIAGVCKSLGAEPATALLVIEEVTFDPKDRQIYYDVHRSLTERLRYINQIR